MRVIAPQAQHETVTPPAEAGGVRAWRRLPTAQRRLLAADGWLLVFAVGLLVLAALLILIVKIFAP